MGDLNKENAQKKSIIVAIMKELEDEIYIDEEWLEVKIECLIQEFKNEYASDGENAITNLNTKIYQSLYPKSLKGKKQSVNLTILILNSIDSLGLTKDVIVNKVNSILEPKK